MLLVLNLPSLPQFVGKKEFFFKVFSNWNPFLFDEKAGTNSKKIHSFFYSQRFFKTQPQCCLTSSRIELQMLLSCCLIYISIIILRHFLYFLYLCPCLDLGLFMLYLFDLFFIFIFIFMMINRIIQSIQKHLFFCLFFRICSIIFR